jgi:hypothetical protein
MCRRGTGVLQFFLRVLFVIIIQSLKSNWRGVSVKEVNRRTLQTGLEERQTSMRLLGFKIVTIVKGF